MIPKKIHYIWLGGAKKPNLSNICINSWKEKLQDYEIIEWNEKNLDLDKIAEENEFFKKCREKKLWAYMADYLRLYILYNYGGIYFDTDVQVIKTLTPLLDTKFLCGMEIGNHYGTAVIGSEAYNPIIKKLLDFYESKIWEIEIYTIPYIFGYVFNEDKELLKDITIYPIDYFSPYNYQIDFKQSMITKNTYTIHWFDGTWKENKNVRTFLQTKHIKNPILRACVIAKKWLGYYYRKLLKK